MRLVAAVATVSSGATTEAGAIWPIAFECRGGQAEAVGPFRAWHANTRHGPFDREGRAPRLACQPWPAPRPRPGSSAGGPRATRQRRSHRLPGERVPRRKDVIPALAASKPCPAGSGLWGRAGLAREARRKPWRKHGASSCVRVPSPERPYGLGLAATALERPLSSGPAKSATSRLRPVDGASPRQLHCSSPAVLRVFPILKTN